MAFKRSAVRSRLSPPSPEIVRFQDFFFLCAIVKRSQSDPLARSALASLERSHGGFAARVARLATPTGAFDCRDVHTFVTRAIVLVLWKPALRIPLHWCIIMVMAICNSLKRCFLKARQAPAILTISKERFIYQYLDTLRFLHFRLDLVGECRFHIYIEGEDDAILHSRIVVENQR